MRRRHGSGIFAGLLFLALGVMLLIGNLNLVPIQPVLSQWWPLLLIIVGIKKLLLYGGSTAWIGALFWMGTGILFLASTLGYINVGIPSLLWPVMLIWFGVFTVLGCSARCDRQLSSRSE